MRTLIAILALALCAPLSALNIPSSVSGVYAGPDRVCSLVLAEDTALNKLGELHCVAWAPTDQVYNVVSIGAPDGTCPTDTQVFQFRSVFAAWLTPDTPGFRIVGIDANSITVRVGIPGELGLGDGALQTWQRIASLSSPAPYACGTVAPSPHYPRLCRLYGLYCGG